jgi:putative endonuclease
MVRGILDFKMLFFPYKSFRNKRRAHLRLGRWGEEQSCKLLQRKGFTILLRNYRSHVGELDIIALDGKTLVFVEVKTLFKATVFRPVHNYSYRQRHTPLSL